ncbi:hypothetical protein ACFVHQ_05335 [Actinomycetes bacterium NPDC127524]
MKDKKASFIPDTPNEGKNSAYLDIDRIINEGLAGGNVFQAEHEVNIEESHDIDGEEENN